MKKAARQEGDIGSIQASKKEAKATLLKLGTHKQMEKDALKLMETITRVAMTEHARHRLRLNTEDSDPPIDIDEGSSFVDLCAMACDAGIEASDFIDEPSPVLLRGYMNAYFAALVNKAPADMCAEMKGIYAKTQKKKQDAASKAAAKAAAAEKKKAELKAKYDAAKALEVALQTEIDTAKSRFREMHPEIPDANIDTMAALAVNKQLDKETLKTIRDYERKLAAESNGASKGGPKRKRTPSSPSRDRTINKNKLAGRMRRLEHGSTPGEGDYTLATDKFLLESNVPGSIDWNLVVATVISDPKMGYKDEDGQAAPISTEKSVNDDPIKKAKKNKDDKKAKKAKKAKKDNDENDDKEVKKDKKDEKVQEVQEVQPQENNENAKKSDELDGIGTSTDNAINVNFSSDEDDDGDSEDDSDQGDSDQGDSDQGDSDQGDSDQGDSDYGDSEHDDSDEDATQSCDGSSHEDDDPSETEFMGAKAFASAADNAANASDDADPLADFMSESEDEGDTDAGSEPIL